MSNLKADSPLCRRIVLSFLDFLNSVEPAPDRDLESLEVAKECLLEAFKIELSSVDSASKSDSLVDIFSLRKETEQREVTLHHSHEGFAADAPSISSAYDAANINIVEVDERRRDTHTLGISEDELFGQFFGALEKIHYFGIAPDEHDDQVQLDRATDLFHNALKEMQNSGCQKFDQKNLAETFKSQGNRAMQSKQYSDAIELYTVAIALCDDNAVYYCNRAAAYTQINQYTEAIRDCYKSIEIDPNYGKAYSRLGFAYYAQGNYMDAIHKGFLRALQLDPTNESVKENIRVAEQKLRAQHQITEHDQNSSNPNQHSGGGSRNHAPPPPFSSMPFNLSGLPADMASMFVNMANVNPGQHSQERPEEGSEPEIRIGSTNINVNLGDQMPEEISGALRSVMQMFSGGASAHVNSQDNPNPNPNPNPNGGASPS